MSNQDPFYEGRQRFYTNVQQQVESEEYYPRDPVAQEDFMLDRVDDLYDRGVITDTEALNIFASWVSKRRPDTTVIHLGVQPPSRPFYE